MSKKVDHYGSQYSNFLTNLYHEIRKEIFKEDIGQNGWLTADEQDIFIDWLNLDSDQILIDIACGSGGPTLRLAEKTGCKVIGIDTHEKGIETANKQKDKLDFGEKATFKIADGSSSLPFDDESFDALVCIDAINHLPKREIVIAEWNRILKPKGKLLFTDPIVVTGILTNEEIEIRASIGYFLFATSKSDNEILKNTGFNILKEEDRTENMAKTARSWKNAREKRKKDLIKAEGLENYYGQQKFFDVCATLAEEKRLSRFAYLSEKL